MTKLVSSYMASEKAAHRKAENGNEVETGKRNCMETELETDVET